MREILFRAYSKLLKEYIVSEFSIFGEWLTFDMFGQFISENWDKYKEHYDSKILAVNDFVVEQFIGILDKNGKKIFEGDICLTHYPNSPDITDCETEIVSIIWNNYGHRYQIMDRNEMRHSLFGEVVLEIIGNIHVNPELLEVDHGKD